MPPFMTGGQMILEVTSLDATFRPPPRRLEAGTPPIVAAVGLIAAAEWMQSLDWRAAQDDERLGKAGLGS
jgi:selenocysteine lyase/cysteine desulfurase